MPTVLPFEGPSDYVRVLRIIRRLWDEGAVHFEAHAVRRMGRRGFDVNDVERVIRQGEIIEHNRPRADRGWRYVVAGVTVDGIPAACVVTIEARLIIITVRRREESP